jgi:hypothetical protein
LLKIKIYTFWLTKHLKNNRIFEIKTHIRILLQAYSGRGLPWLIWASPYFYGLYRAGQKPGKIRVGNLKPKLRKNSD